MRSANLTERLGACKPPLDMWRRLSLPAWGHLAILSPLLPGGLDHATTDPAENRDRLYRGHCARRLPRGLVQRAHAGHGPSADPVEDADRLAAGDLPRRRRQAAGGDDRQDLR